MADYQNREFSMSDANFSTICRLAHDYTGIVLSDRKKGMVYGRLARRLRSLNLQSFDQYCERIASAKSEEVVHFIDAITTNLTSFFREQHHFEFLANTVLPSIAIANKASRRLRIWSAGCSTGEEPYSLAITLNENFDCAGWDCKILATDLDTKVLDKGKRGLYEIERVESLAKAKRQTWFLEDINHPDVVKVKPELQKLVFFKRLNLLGDWPMKGPFDVIFCRNVVIYFNKETQKMLFNRYADMIADGGYLFIGHSESLHRVTDRFRPVGRTIYQKVY